jgi:ABC-2 type transport system permease protein
VTTIAAAPPRVRPGASAAGFAGEVHKGLVNLLAGWRAVIIQMILFPAFYLLLVLFMGRGQLHRDLLVSALFGMVALTFIHEQVNRAFWGYLGDIQSGVLEQTYLTPLPSAALVLGRQVAAAVSALPTALAVLVTGIAAVAIRGGRVPLDAQMLVPLAATVLGTCGLALILCGLTLVFKRIEIITQLSVAVYAIAGGTLVPLSALPGWTAFLSRLLVPVAPGVEAVRDILAGHSLTTLSSGWGLWWLLLQPVLITTTGVVLFVRLERLAKRRGTLGRY